MRLSVWIWVLFALACGSDDLPLKAQEGFDDQPALDTGIRREPGQEWDSGIVARDISWHYHHFTRLEKSISVIGIFAITFVNNNPDQDVETNVLVRFIGADGFQHVPYTPSYRVAIEAGGTTQFSENFIVEVKDQATANGISRMSIVVY